MARYGDIFRKNGELLEFSPVGYMPVGKNRDISGKTITDLAPPKPVASKPAPAAPVKQAVAPVPEIDLYTMDIFNICVDSNTNFENLKKFSSELYDLIFVMIEL